MVSLLTNGNLFFTAVFAVESAVKLFAMSPRYFFAVCIFCEQRNCCIFIYILGWMELF